MSGYVRIILLMWMMGGMTVCAHAQQQDYLDFGESLIDTAEKLKMRDPKRAMEIAKMILDANQFEGRLEDKVRALLVCANSMKMIGTRAEALDLANQAYALAKQIRSPVSHVQSAYMKASIFSQADMFDSSLFYFQEAIHQFGPGMDTFFLADSYSSVGRVYRQIGNNTKAEEYILKGYQLSRSDDSYTMVFTLTEVIEFYQSIGDSTYRKYLDTLAMTSFFRNATPEIRMAHFGSFLGIHGLDGPQREQKLREQFEYGLQHSSPANQVGWGLILYEELRNNQKFFEAQPLLEKLYIVAVESESGFHEANVLRAQFENARTLGQFENAILFLEKYVDLKEELLSEENRNILTKLNIKFETAQKDNEIAQQQIHLTQANRNKIFLTSLVALLAVLGGIVFFFFRQKARTAHRIAEQERIIQIKEKERLEQEKQVAELNTSLDSQEKERNRIARELQEGIGSMMNAIAAHAEVLHASGQKKQHLLEFRALVKETISEVSRTSHELIPASLLRQGIEPALRDLCMNVLIKSGISASVEIQGDVSEIPQDQQLLIYRIVQELFQNIIRHAGATQVLLQFTRFENDVALVVEDNGHGYDTSRMPTGGIGMNSIRSRIELLGADLDIASSASEGTTTTINFKMSHSIV